ncbi:MAG TPA: ribonuclease P protein component [Bacteroidales bacterium]|nr:ribonuclease P protein component [Bacteroidales bacterium]HPZ02681.1 ribonuclease P protein component [Bacteroidales bacterium]HQB74419.1 ribonuclease P protein component [Bacteroidales bacterium]HQQ20818.1 ribonuclease P protein component [Bacteroidales bacterium]
MLQEEDKSIQNYSFNKSERLCSRKSIENLLRDQRVCYHHPIKCYYAWEQKQQSSDQNQIAIAVPKKNFKKAVIRNKIKRRIRESYRLNKQQFLVDYLSKSDQKVNLLFHYTSKKEHTFAVIERAVIDVLKELTATQ